MPDTQRMEKAITTEELNRALEGCEQEPIHIPGTIQPHGYLLVMDADFKIQKCSRNFLELSGVEAGKITQSHASDFTELGGLNQLRDKILGGSLNPIRYSTLPFKFGNRELNLNAIMHRSAEFLVLELEHDDALGQETGHADFYQEIMQFSLQLQKVQSQSALHEFLVSQIRKLTGFDRVKLYRFDEQWNGEVIAEDKALHMTSYRNLRFPASDIPKQARALYSRNYIRLIPDTGFRPVSIVPDDIKPDGAALDLSFSCLRSVSPVHIEYLKNMGIAASMSISVMQNGRLWGLIACHHNEPLKVSYPVRMAAELMAHTFSAFLSNFMQSHLQTDTQSRQAYLRELHSAIEPSASLLDLLKNKHSLVLQAVRADGVYIRLGGKDFTFGLTPEVSFSQSLIKWLEENYEDQFFASNSIARDTGLPVQGQSIASGAVAVPVSTSMTDYMIWFRQERSSEVFWAGKPEKKVTQEKAGYRLTPRSSFALWKENQRGFSDAWTADDLDAAKNIAKLLLNKRYEDSLRQADHDLQSILNNSSALVYITDIKGCILRMNDSYLELLGKEHSAVLGEHFSSLFDEVFAETISDQHAQVVTEQKSITFDNSAKIGGREYQFIAVKFPLYDSNKDVYAVCSIATDVSTLLHTQHELTRSNKELERVAFVASHDLQEPIRMIGNFTRLLKDEYFDKKLDETAKEYVDFMLHSAERMRVLIQDLLQYSRVGQEEGAPTLIDTSECLAEVLAQLELGDPDYQADIRSPSELPSIVMKPEHFTCVMQNLIANGIKYRCPDRLPQIIVNCESTGDYWRFSVSDNGIGINRKYHKKVFEIFQRLHAKSQYEGTGIGLALCARIVDRYEGSIWLESEEGVGSTFFFTIPKNARIVK